MSTVYVRCLSDKKEKCFSKVSVGKEESIGKGYEPPFPERKHKVVGYCNGLFCLEFDGKSLLWNPSKKEFKFLPPSELKPPSCPSRKCTRLECTIRTVSGVRGLGFDPKSEDYKVVAFATNFYTHCKNCYSTKQVEVYSLRDDCWKNIANEGDEYYILDEYATYADGSVYWIANTSNYFGYLIISLDLTNYKFSRVDVPGGGGGGICITDSRAFLTDYQGRLAFIVHDLEYNEWQEEKYKMMTCLVRGPDGWIETMDNFKFHGAEKPLGFCGDVLMLEANDGGLLIYDSYQKLVRKIEGIYDYSLCMCIFPFMKSKVHLKSKWSLLQHKRKGKETMEHQKEESDGEE